jgi:hypothetical protein
MRSRAHSIFMFRIIADQTGGKLLHSFGQWQTNEYWLQQNPIIFTNFNKAMFFLSSNYTMKFCLMHTPYLPPFLRQNCYVYAGNFLLFHLALEAQHSINWLCFFCLVKVRNLLYCVHYTDTIANPGHFNFTTSTKALLSLVRWMMQSLPSQISEDPLYYYYAHCKPKWSVLLRFQT